MNIHLSVDTGIGISRAWLFVVACIASASLCLIGAPPSHAVTCAPVKFIGVAGSGQRDGSNKYANRGMGDVMNSFYEELTTGQKVSQGLVQPYAIPYDAVSVDFGGSWGSKMNLVDANTFAVPSNPFWRSVVGGANQLVSYVHKQASGRCRSKTKLVLGGYSQGAAVLHVALSAISKSDRKVIAAVVAFGDPLFWADENAYGSYDPAETGASMNPSIEGPIKSLLKWPSDLPVFNFCTAYDPVCNFYRPVFGTWGPKVWNLNTVSDNHLLTSYYGAGWIRVAAQMAANRLNLRSLAADGIGADPRRGPLDVVFAIDTTGSMEDDIDVVEETVTRMASQLSTTSPDFRVGLVEYRDNDDFQSRVALGLTSDLSGFSAALSNLTADGGGDYEESVYSGVMSAIQIGFRPGSKRSVIVVGDAPPKDPEPVTGATNASVIQAVLAAGSTQVFGIFSGVERYELQEFESIANQSGGNLYTLGADPILLRMGVSLNPNEPRSPNALAASPAAGAIDDEVSNSIVESIRAAGATPRISIAAPRVLRSGLAATVTSTIDSGETPAAIEWDVDGDGTFEPGGRSFKFAPAGVGIRSIVVRYTLADGLVALGSAQVEVRESGTKSKSKKLIGKLKLLSIKRTRKAYVLKLRYKRRKLQPAPQMSLLLRGRSLAGVSAGRLSRPTSTIKFKVSKRKAKGRRIIVRLTAFRSLSPDAIEIQTKTSLRVRLR